MARNLPNAARAEIVKQISSEIFHELVTISHPDWNQTYYFYNDIALDPLTAEPARLTSRGNQYIAYPFEWNGPVTDGITIPRIQLKISNVDRELVDIIRSIQSPIQMRFETVMRSDPDILDTGPFRMQLISVEYDAQVITGDLPLAKSLDTRYPKGSFVPRTNQGIF